MATPRNPVRLGITIVVMFVLFFAMLIFIGKGDFFRPAEKTLTVRFPSGVAMPEINDGAFVTYFGQKVGKVVSTRVVEDADPANPARQVHFLEIKATYPAYLGLRSDCRVVATGPPLGGQGQLDILIRGVRDELLQTDHPVQGEVRGFQTVVDRISREVDDTDPNSIMSALKLQLDPNDEKSITFGIRDSFQNIRNITAGLNHELDRTQGDVLLTKLHASLDKIDTGLREIVDLLKENRPKVDRTLTTVEHAANTLDAQVITVMAEELELQETPDVSLRTKVRSAFDRLNQSLADINVVTEQTRGIVILNRERIGQIVQNAAEASDHLKDGIKDLKLHPWKLLFPPTDEQQKELLVLNTAREFASAAARLDDAASQMRALLETRQGSISIDDAQFLEIRDQLTETSEKFKQAEQAVWTQFQLE